MVERIREKPKLTSMNRLERWSLFSGVLVWIGVVAFSVGLVLTLRNERNERLAYASLPTSTPTIAASATARTVVASATATPTATPTAQRYPVGWSTATPTLVASPTRIGDSDPKENTSSRNKPTTEPAAPELGLTPKPPPLPPEPPDRLVIPQIELDSPIVPIGWVAVEQQGARTRVWEVADYAVGWHKTSSYPGRVGNIVLNGHHNIKGEIFRYLVDLELGDHVHVYAQDQQYTFAVSEKHILKEKGEPLDVRRENAKWIEPTVDQRLTMITCWPYTNNTHRLVIVAKPVPTRSLEGLVE
jgi:sortase A